METEVSYAKKLLYEAGYKDNPTNIYREFIDLFKARYNENWTIKAQKFYEAYLSENLDELFCYQELYDLGLAYETGSLSKIGIKVPKNLEKAFRYYNLAKKNTIDNTDAAHKLVDFYQNGLGIEKDYKKAIELLIEMTSLDDPKSFNTLGEYYFDGLGVEKDYNKTFYYCMQSAKRDYAEGQYNVGFCYENGYGVEQSYSSALEWYKKSAEQGFELSVKKLNGIEEIEAANVESEQNANNHTNHSESFVFFDDSFQATIEKQSNESFNINRYMKVIPYKNLLNSFTEPVKPDMFGLLPQYLLIEITFAEKYLSSSALKYAKKTETDYIYEWTKSSYIVTFELPTLFKDVSDVSFADILRFIVKYCYSYLEENNITSENIYTIYKENCAKGDIEL